LAGDLQYDRRMVTILRGVVPGVAALGLATSLIGARVTADPVDRFTAFAINMTDLSRAATAMVEIDIEQWSSDADRDRLLKILNGKGQREFLTALRAMPRAAVVRSPGGFGLDVRFAHRMVLPDRTEHILLIAQRPIDLQFEAQRPGVGSYPFAMAELRIEPKGEGEGKLSLATKLTGNPEKGFVRGQDYDRQPMSLTQVKRATK
jgi:hypothetical protein